MMIKGVMIFSSSDKSNHKLQNLIQTHLLIKYLTEYLLSFFKIQGINSNPSCLICAGLLLDGYKTSHLSTDQL